MHAILRVYGVIIEIRRVMRTRMAARCHRGLHRAATKLLLVLFVATAVAAPGSVTYNYDALGRLTSAQYSDGNVANYALDPAGNRANPAPASFPVLAFSAASYSVSEGGGSVTITVNRTQQSSGAVSVQYATADGTATAGRDYTTSTGTLNWASGDSAPKTFTVPIIDDAIYEGNEYFAVNLTNSTGGAILGFQSTATVTVTDNDAVSFAIAGASVSEGGGFANVTVTRTGASLVNQTVQYATSDGTATAGADYTAESGTLVFTPQDASKTIAIPILEDTVYEGNETFTVTLTNPTNGATLTTPVATVTIVDDDPPPTFALSPLAVTVSELTSTVTFTVTKAGATALPHSVTYATSSGTATSGSDFVPANGILTFAPAAVTQTFNVTIINDTVIENNESFTVNLSAPTNGATITTGPATVTIIDNDNPTMAVPQNLNGYDPGTGIYKIFWDISSGAVSYYVLERSLASTFTSPTDFTVTAPNTFANFGSPNFDKTYYFRAKACNAAASCTAWSATLVFTASGIQ